MERSPNSLEEVQLGGVVRISDRHTAPWQRLQQLQRWKTHMQRLGQALANDNLGQSRYEFEALVNDVPEPGQADPMAHPLFALLGRALQSLNLAGAREAFAHLLNEVPSLNHHHHQRKERQEELTKEAKADASDDTEPHGLDVTA